MTRQTANEQTYEEEAQQVHNLNAMKEDDTSEVHGFLHDYEVTRKSCVAKMTRQATNEQTNVDKVGMKEDDIEVHGVVRHNKVTDKTEEQGIIHEFRDDETEEHDKIYQFREACGRFVNHETVQWVIIALISTNSIMMGIGTYDMVTENPKVEHAFETTNLIFLIIFTIELGLQFIYHGCRLFLDGWLVFDFIIVFLSWSFQEVQVIRAFRILRALRLITRVKDLRNLVMALFDVLPRLSAIMLILSLVFYIFSVMFTSLFRDLYKDGFTDFDYFGRLDYTFFTLFQILTLDWAWPVRMVMVEYTWAWAPFMVFICTTAFIVFNLIVAVICDSVSMLNERVHEEEDKKSPGLRIRTGQVKNDLSRLSKNQEAIKIALESIADVCLVKCK